jgi:hypothetical protein
VKPKPYVQIQAAGALLATLLILIVLGQGPALAVASSIYRPLAVWFALSIPEMAGRIERV